MPGLRSRLRDEIDAGSQERVAQWLPVYAEAMAELSRRIRAVTGAISSP